MPPALCLVLWKHDIDRWLAFHKHGERIGRAVEKLSDLIWKTKLGPMYEPALENLRRTVQPAAWTETAGPHLTNRNRPGSPIERAVYSALAEALWSAAETRWERAAADEDLSHLSPRAQRILRKAASQATEQRPRELFDLIADIIYHLPLARGLPDRQTYVDAPVLRSSPQSGNAIRKIIQG